MDLQTVVYYALFKHVHVAVQYSLYMYSNHLLHAPVIPIGLLPCANLRDVEAHEEFCRASTDLCCRHRSPQSRSRSSLLSGTSEAQLLLLHMKQKMLTHKQSAKSTSVVRLTVESRG